jgi:hypothetical protein
MGGFSRILQPIGLKPRDFPQLLTHSLKAMAIHESQLPNNSVFDRVSQIEHQHQQRR